MKHDSPFFIFFMLYQHKSLPVKTHILLFDSIWYVSKVSSGKVYQESRVLDFVDPSPLSDSEAIGCCLKLMMLHSVRVPCDPRYVEALWSTLWGADGLRGSLFPHNPKLGEIQRWYRIHELIFIRFHWFAFSRCFLYVYMRLTSWSQSIYFAGDRWTCECDETAWVENTIGWRMPEMKVASSRRISIVSGYLQLFWKLRRSIKKNPWLLLPFTSIGQLQVSVVCVHFSWID